MGIKMVLTESWRSFCRLVGHDLIKGTSPVDKTSLLLFFLFHSFDSDVIFTDELYTDFSCCALGFGPLIIAVC